MPDNSANNKRIAKNSMLLYGRMVIVMAIGLYSSRIVLQSLGVEDYGIYNLVGGLVVFFAVINGAMLSSTQRYINYGMGNTDKGGLPEIFNTARIIHALLAVIIVCAAESVGLWLLTHKLQIPPDKAGAAMFVFQISIATVVIQVVTIPYNAVLVAHERMSVFAVISIIQAALTLAAAFALNLMDSHRLWLYAILMCIVQMVVALFYFFYCRSHFSETRIKTRLSKALFKEMSVFAGWCMVGCTAGILFTQGLNILLGIFFLPYVNAARGIAVIIQNAISQIFNNVQTAVVPQLLQSYARRDYTYFNSLVFKSSKYFSLLLLIVAIPFFIRAPYIIQLWLGEEPEYTVIFTRILLGVALIEAISAPLMRASEATGDIRKYHLVVGGILLTIVPIAYVVLKLGGQPQSVFYVYLVVSCVALAGRLILQQKINLPVGSYLVQVLMRIGMVLAVAYPLCRIISDYLSFNFLGLVIFCVITTAIIGFAIVVFGMTSNERSYLIAKLHSVFIK